MYTKEQLESIKKVEATRAQRLAQVLAGGLRCASRISDVLVAEIAKGISALLLCAKRGDDLRVLFGLREIYRNVYLSVLRGVEPLEILYYAVFADVIAIKAKAIEIVGCLFGRFCVILGEGLVDNGGQGSEKPISSVSKRSRKVTES